MVVILIGIQLVLVAVQMFAGWRLIKHHEDILWGFASWGSLPNVAIMIVVLNLKLLN
jgi:hypothetical protein